MKVFNHSLLTVGLVAASSYLISCQSAQQTAFVKPEQTDKRPNILLLFTDDQTYQSIHSLTNSEIRTPNMDRLVKNGVTFTHAFNMGAWGGAVCVASRAMLITGRPLWHAGGVNAGGGKHTLMGETFKNAGYNTFFTGKWHNQSKALNTSYTHIGQHGGGMFSSTAVGGAAYNRPGPKKRWTPYETKWKGHWRKDKKSGEVTHSSELWANESIDFLTNVASKDEKPFFMYTAFHAPHDPRQSPKEFVDMYPLDKIKTPVNFLPEHPFDQGCHTVRDELLAPIPRTANQVKTHIQEYYAIITHADYQIGRILDALEKSGKADNTYIIFSSDHGLACGQHGLLGKQNMYDHSMRVPFMINGPGIKAGTKNDSLIYLHSIFPTACELANIDKPKSVMYPSLVPLMTGEKKSYYKQVYGSYRGVQRMLRNNNYKLIVYLPDNGSKKQATIKAQTPHPEFSKSELAKEFDFANEVQLFDMVNDPNEMNDLSNDPKYASLVRTMMNDLMAEMKNQGDPVNLRDLENAPKFRNFGHKH